MIDVTLICGRRPDLLSVTLNSLYFSILKNFQVNGVFANIDPFGGNAADAERCRSLILKYFPGAEINQPSTASFGKAVKWVWSRSRSSVVFHLEDDWVALQDLAPQDCLHLLKGKTAALKLLTRPYHFWTSAYQKSPKLKRDVSFFGVPLFRVRASIFSTSPTFFRGDFIRHCADLMNPDLDPEKQFRPEFNPRLFAYAQQFRCRKLGGRRGYQLLADIGRNWRKEQGIKKMVSQGKSTWVRAHDNFEMVEEETAGVFGVADR